LDDRGPQNNNCPGYIAPATSPWLIPGVIAAAVVLVGIVGVFLTRRRKQSKVEAVAEKNTTLPYAAR
jgi:hypothetical protein